MIMIGHAYISQQRNVVYLQRIRQLFKEHVIIVVVLENVLPFVSTTGDMVICAWILDSEGSGHGLKLPHIF